MKKQYDQPEFLLWSPEPTAVLTGEEENPLGETLSDTDIGTGGLFD